MLPFPSVVWQVYDWYMMPNAGYYFMQNACEPVHIQLNIVNHKVLALNRTYKNIAGLKAVADVYGMDSKSLFHEEKDLDLGATEVEETIDLSAVLKDSKDVRFVVLRLKDNSGKTYHQIHTGCRQIITSSRLTIWKKPGLR
jgi:hypothetical protein